MQHKTEVTQDLGPIHLNRQCLELAKRTVLTGPGTIFCYQASDVHTQITPRGKEDEAIDRLVEPST